ncbi:GMC oxidoreductase [Pseudooceanicola aestuarii]|uniref:GMC oxidoreductase n=1 Tax=Pseudooceanicola aestuarii TaxID=2697319 RepID=UPI0013D747AB|nr:GMC family oxidoreductase [Pseudooceanicola aestuarii]
MNAHQPIALRDWPAGQPLTAEICVIGSGPAGGILAAELARGGCDVLLVEAGATERGLPGVLPELTAVQGRPAMGPALARQVGGGSNFWAGRVTPLDPVDFAPRDWVDIPGWPLAHADLAPYVQRSLALLSLPDPAKLVAVGSAGAFGSALEQGDVIAKTALWSDPPFRVADLLGRAPGLRIVTEAEVTALHSDGGQVIAARLLGLGGRQVDVRARSFVLAAGGLEVPRLLLNSTDEMPEGLGNGYDQVGRYLSTHPKANLAVLRLRRAMAPRHALYLDCRDGGQSCRMSLTLPENVQRDQKLLNHSAQFSVFSEFQASRLFGAVSGGWLTSGAGAGQVTQRAVSEAGLWAWNRVGRLARWQPRAKVLRVRAFLDQYPDPQNRVHLSAARDAAGRRVCAVQWRYTRRDRQSVVKFLNELSRVCAARGIGTLHHALNVREEWPLTALHSHFMGTTRMSRDPATGVVDANCRVHGTRNLYVAGPSVFSTYGNANPFLTIAALSLRLADHLLAKSTAKRREI